MTVRVGVVGAGPAGLCAAKHSQAAGMSCTVFEQTNCIGGTWQYTECVGTDSYGIPIHTSMYRDLRINLPKEVVSFPDLPHKDDQESYVTSEIILDYLLSYADNFNLHKLIKFNHCVKNISRSESTWVLTVIDLPANREYTYEFDALFICNGINNKPYTPYITGVENFTGHSVHSHDYRMPEPFTGKKVLVIGGGPSGLDIVHHISRVADKIFLTHPCIILKVEQLALSDNVVLKEDVRQLYSRSVEFVDDCIEDIDTIIYCTGYRCNYSFMDESCGITEDDGWVYPLYKHCINVNHKSMCILGNLKFSMQFQTFDIQVRFFLKTLTNCNILPGKEDMLQNIEKHIKKKLEAGAPKKSYFGTTASEDSDYYDELAIAANIDSVPKVLTKIHGRAIVELFGNFPLFRRDNYKVIDDEIFSVLAEA